MNENHLEYKIFKHVNLESEEVVKNLLKAPIYKKFAEVKARPGKIDEKIETRLSDGLKESFEIVKNEGDMVVTNPDGEKYVVPVEEFKNSYEETEVKEVFRPKGFCRAIENPFKEPIEIDAPWGEVEKEYANCMVVTKCDKDGNVKSKPYLIGNKEFKDTYKQVA